MALVMHLRLRPEEGCKPPQLSRPSASDPKIVPLPYRRRVAAERDGEQTSPRAPKLDERFVPPSRLGCVPATMTPALEVRPERPLLYEVLSTRVSGLSLRQEMILRAEIRNRFDQRWASEAAFEVDDDGLVDLSTLAPIWGSYAGVDAMGLFWSMALDPPDAPGSSSPQKGLDPLLTTLTGEPSSSPVAEARFERLPVAPGGARMPVRDEGLVATLFEPPDAPAPGIIVLGGGSGGLPEPAAALLASRDFTTLALAYFGVEDLPSELIELPLEYFETAIDWLRRRESVVGERRLGVTGSCKGGELVLLLGTASPWVGAVVGLVPSGVLTNAISDAMTTSATRSGWSYGGRPLPFAAPADAAVAGVQGEECVALRSLYLSALRDPEAVERATIPVKLIEGPVLLFSGEDDQVWPSTQLSDVAMQWLAQRGPGYPREHVCYQGAGHRIPTPYLPTTIRQTGRPSSGMAFVLGGTPEADAVASADSWARTLPFFAKHLGETR